MSQTLLPNQKDTGEEEFCGSGRGETKKCNKGHKDGGARMVVLLWDRSVRKSVVRWEQGYWGVGRVVGNLEWAQAMQKVAAWYMSKATLGLQYLSHSATGRSIE